jgi:hypothetical protein
MSVFSQTYQKNMRRTKSWVYIDCFFYGFYMHKKTVETFDPFFNRGSRSLHITDKSMCHVESWMRNLYVAHRSNSSVSCRR